MKNQDVADILYEIADFLEIQDVDFKPRAYRRAARNIEALNEDIVDVHERGELEEIEGVGESIAEKISEYLETGELEYYNELKDDLPIDIDAITRVEGVGPKSAKKLYEALGISDLDDLEDAAKNGEIASVEGFGEKSQQKILDHIEFARQGEERMLLGRAFPLVDEVLAQLSAHDAFDNTTVVGSFRRRRPTVGDIDILATSPDPGTAMDIFTTEPDVEEVFSKGETKASVRVSGDLQIDLRIVDEGSYGAAKQYFTGSKEHNVEVRKRAVKRGWKLNEYGVFDSNDVKITGEEEAAVYAELDMAWVPPELRENTGEVDAAENDALPELVTTEDINGDLQMHTTASDGSNSVRELTEKAAELGYEYILITDHGPSLQVAGGITRETFDEQREAVIDANEEFDVQVLHGVEANVTQEGLDVPEAWCDDCDLVVMALHDRLDEATDRVVEVMNEYSVDIFAHPQNRIINEREAIELDLDRITEVAAANNVAIEINAQPDRLDLDWQSVKSYRDTVKYVVSTDSHSVNSLEYMHLGVSQARRGWCEASHVLNTRSLDDLLAYFD